MRVSFDAEFAGCLLLLPASLFGAKNEEFWPSTSHSGDRPLACVLLSERHILQWWACVGDIARGPAQRKK